MNEPKDLIKRPQVEMVELLNVIAKQNEDLIEIQNNKIDILCAIDARDELVMKMYKRKNLVSSIFGVFGLGLTGVNVALVAIGMMFLPEETKALFNHILAMVTI